MATATKSGMLRSENTCGTFPILNLNSDFFDKMPYDEGPVLGRGMSGNVVLASCKDKPEVKRAVKLLPLIGTNTDELIKRLFLRELSIFNITNHPGLVKCILAAQCPSHLAVVTKFYPLGDLNRCLLQVPPNSKTWIASTLSEAVSYLHTTGIMHGDIKLENIFMDIGFKPVLGDFGLSRHIKKDELTLPANKIGGTKEYLAPEISSRDVCLQVDPFKVDTYALGVVILSLVSLLRPRVGLDYLEVAKEYQHIPAYQRLILEVCLDPDFKTRCTSHDLMQLYSKVLKRVLAKDKVSKQI